MPNKTQKGTSLYLTILIMSVLLGVGLGISTLLIRQMRMIRGVGDSAVAFYAADSGIEKAIYAFYKVEEYSDPNTIVFSGTLDNLSKYSVTGFSPGPNCPAPNQYFCIRSVGTYKGVRRAIEVSR